LISRATGKYPDAAMSPQVDPSMALFLGKDSTSARMMGRL
jgi:hypothetical protein